MSYAYSGSPQTQYILFSGVYIVYKYSDFFSSQPRVLDLFLHHQQLRNFSWCTSSFPPFNYE